jgi:predicted PurR-regulated permease PerM
MLHNYVFRSFMLVAALFIGAIYTGFLPLLFAGLVSYGTVRFLSNKLISFEIHSDKSNFIAISTVAIVVVGSIFFIGFGLNLFIRNDSGLMALGDEVIRVIESADTWAPAWVAELLPEKAEIVHNIGDWLKEHIKAIGSAGMTTLKTFGYAMIGILLGAMVAVRSVVAHEKVGPITGLLFNQLKNLDNSFWAVVGAQLKITSLNTFFTSVYILAILPMFDITLPFGKTLILVTFIAGLIPVIGNLISNSAIAIISLTVSANTAVASLVYLIVIHKLEYFINAKIVGDKINAKSFEILLVLIIGEHFFGIAGVIAGPIFYSWFKAEWIKADKIKSISNENKQNIQPDNIYVKK